MNLNDYITLGRSGLKVSPLCLGTMSFGTEWAWGNDEATSKAVFDHYLDVGGNFIDTADLYTNGRSEEFVGKFIRDRKARDRAVLATKFTFNPEPGNPNAGGNGRKNIYRALEGSLKRLGTDYIDLYWMHVWDTVTPVEEVVDTLHDLVQAGKIRHAGFLRRPRLVRRPRPDARGKGRQAPPHRAAARILAGRAPHRARARRRRAGTRPRHLPVESARGRLPLRQAHAHRPRLVGPPRAGPHLQQSRRRQIQRAKLEDRRPAGRSREGNRRSPAEVALNWVVNQPGITSTIIGVTKLEQLKSNLDSLSVTIPEALIKKLDQASQLDVAHPYIFFGEFIQNNVRGGVSVKAWKG